MTVARCVAETRCYEWDARRQVAAWTDDQLCAACLRVAQRDVHALVYDYVDLEQAIVGVKRDTEMVSGTREQTLLIAAGIEALQRAIWLVTTTWEEIVRDVAHLSTPAARVRDGFAVQRAVETLEPRLRLLAGVGLVAVMPYGPDGPPTELTGAEGVLGMVALHAGTRSVLGITKLVNAMPGECSQCAMSTLRKDDSTEAFALRRDNGSDTVYCANCGARWTWDEYRAYVSLTLTWANLR